MNWIKLLILSLLCLSVPQFMKKEFKLPPIHAGIPFNPNWETSPPSDEILAILNQPFHYFSHGNQSTVFQSEDGKYVLKIFRYRRSLFPIVHNVKNWFKKKPKQDFAAKVNKTFNAAHIASTKGKPFTHVIFCHLNLTKNLLPTIQLKAGKTYTVPLDSYRFALQKKVSPFKETLLKAKDSPEEMKRLIDSFIQLLVDRSALNIRNSDPNLGPNFGFLDGQAVELDFGNYHMIEPNSQIRKEEIENFMNRFQKWLNNNAPQYVISGI
jgi:hypothetical protein